MFTFKEMGTELYLKAKAFLWMLIDNTHPCIPSTREIVWPLRPFQTDKFKSLLF